MVGIRSVVCFLFLFPSFPLLFFSLFGFIKYFLWFQIISSRGFVALRLYFLVFCRLSYASFISLFGVNTVLLDIKSNHSAHLYSLCRSPLCSCCVYSRLPPEVHSAVASVLHCAVALKIWREGKVIILPRNLFCCSSFLWILVSTWWPLSSPSVAFWSLQVCWGGVSAVTSLKRVLSPSFLKDICQLEVFFPFSTAAAPSLCLLFLLGRRLPCSACAGGGEGGIPGGGGGCLLAACRMLSRFGSLARVRMNVVCLGFAELLGCVS